MDAFLLSTVVVALAEIGDKTQLLALVLAARYRQPWTITAGILLATLANHAFAGLVGHWLGSWLTAEILRWVLGLSFLAMAVWMLIPDRLDEERVDSGRWGVLLTTVVVFFLAEMGDKTQVATVALAAQYQSFWAVVAGTTLGMMIANVPVVWIGQRAAQALPVVWMHRMAAGLFAVLGLMALLWQ